MEAFINKNMRLKRSKSWDMRYHWLGDTHLQKYFLVKWAKGTENKADYFTKHVPPAHHIYMRPTLFSTKTKSTTVNLPPRARTINRTPLKPRSSTINNFRPSRCQSLTSKAVNISSRSRIKTFPLNSPIMNLQGCVSTNTLLRKLSRTLTSVY